MIFSIEHILLGVPVTYALIRIWQWIFSSANFPIETRIGVAYFFTLITVTIGAGYMTSDRGVPVFGETLMTYIFPAVLAAALELFRQKRVERRAKILPVD